MEKFFLGKTILVVGASGLLGVNLVTSLLQQSAKVIAADINIDSLKTQLVDAGIKFEKENLILESLDLTNEESVKNLFQNITNIDGAVNTSYPKNKKYGKHFFDVTLDSFNENVSLNLGSSFLFMQQCAEYFVKHKKLFSLVNISSIYGVIAPKFEIYKNTNMTTPVEYVAVKSALINLSKYVVKYVCDSRFRINVVSPGGILDRQPEIFVKTYKSNSLGKGMLEAKDVIKTILFLLSSQSESLNGQNIIVDDGFTI